jgi:hypothetical protein
MQDFNTVVPYVTAFPGQRVTDVSLPLIPTPPDVEELHHLLHVPFGVPGVPKRPPYLTKIDSISIHSPGIVMTT